MKNLSKSKIFQIVLIFIPFCIGFALSLNSFASGDPPNPPSGESTSTEPKCLQYTLVWENDNTPVNPNDQRDFVRVQTTTNPIPGGTPLEILVPTFPNIRTTFVPQEGNATPTISYSRFSPDMVFGGSVNFPAGPHYGVGVKWKCSKTESAQDAGINVETPEGTEECEAAIKIAAKYGQYTALDSLTEGGGVLKGIESFLKNKIIGSTVDFLQKQLKSVVGNINLSSLFGQSGGNITVNTIIQNVTSGNLLNLAENLFPNELKNKAKEAFDKIKKDGEKALKDMANKVTGGLVDKANEVLGEFGGVIPGLGGLSPVPVKDDEVIEGLEKVQANQKTAIQEDLRRDVVQKTRVKCNLLLRQTVQAIKTSLLYQLTTQTVDWIEGGGIQIVNGRVKVNPPQYIKQPGVALKKIGLEAIDRFISKVAPQLCQPLRQQLIINIPSTARETNPYYDPNISCTLNMVLNNIQDFYNDFRSGGWIGFREILLPPNNYYGASMILNQLSSQEALAAQGALQDELNRNAGFPNTYKCVNWSLFEVTNLNLDECSSDPENPNLIYRLSRSQNKCYKLKQTNIESGEQRGNNSSTVKTGIPRNVAQYMNNYENVDFLGNEIFTDNTYRYFYSCEKAEISQTGNVSQKLLERTTEADIDAIINSQDLMNIDAIIQNAIINKVTKVGISGLQGLLSKLPTWTNDLSQFLRQ